MSWTFYRSLCPPPQEGISETSRSGWPLTSFSIFIPMVSLQKLLPFPCLYLCLLFPLPTGMTHNLQSLETIGALKYISMQQVEIVLWYLEYKNKCHNFFNVVNQIKPISCSVFKGVKSCQIPEISHGLFLSPVLHKKLGAYTDQKLGGRSLVLQPLFHWYPWAPGCKIP